MKKYFILISLIPLTAFFITVQAQTVSDGIVYKPVQGKSTGIWPKGGLWTIEKYGEFKNDWGFTKLLVAAYENKEPALSRYYSRALDAGYQPNNLLIVIKDTLYRSIVNSLPAAYYYLGEPVEHNCAGEPSNQYVSHIYPPEELDSIRSYIHEKQPAAEFVLDGYKRCSHLRIAGEHTDRIMYSSYENWNEFTLWSCSVNIGWGNDVESGWENVFSSDIQSESWEDMRNIFGDKFNMGWVDGRGDEYDELFAASNSLGLETVWFYGSSGMDSTTLYEFCESAYKHGWLEKIDSAIVDAPSGLVASETPEGFIRLDWNDNSNDEDGFLIERSLTDTLFFTIDTIPSESTFYIDSVVVPNNQYHYRIRSFNRFDESDYIEISIVLNPQSIIVPSELRTNLTPEHRVQITWRDNSNNELGFILQKMSSSEVEFALLDSIPSGTNIYLDSNLTEGSLYKYRIKAFNTFTESEYSNLDSVYIPFEMIHAPDELAAALDSSMFVKLNWMDNSSNEFGFAIERKKSGESEFVLIDSTSNDSTFYLDVSITENGTFDYRVFAFNHDTTSDYSNEISIDVVMTGLFSEFPGVYTNRIFQNYPNPFNPSTTIKFSIADSRNVIIKLYNTIGKEVLTIFQGNMSAGIHEVEFNSGRLPTGVYFFRLIAGDYTETKKLVILK